MIYLSGVTFDRIEHLLLCHNVGLMVQPKSGYESRIGRFGAWAADNGCFADRWDENSWLDWLARLPSERRLFAVVPDVLADHRSTLRRWERYRPLVTSPAAFVAQNGATANTIPWDELDCLFIGGDDLFKLSEPAWQLVTAAKERGKWVHMGRVNSFRRLRAAAMSGVDSADGTYLAYGPDINIKKLIGWLWWLDRNAHMELFA